MLPAGVDTSTPSETNFFIKVCEPYLIDKDAACLLCLKIETSIENFFLITNLITLKIELILKT